MIYIPMDCLRSQAGQITLRYAGTVCFEPVYRARVLASPSSSPAVMYEPALWIVRSSQPSIAARLRSWRDDLRAHPGLARSFYGAALGFARITRICKEAVLRARKIVAVDLRLRPQVMVPVQGRPMGSFVEDGRNQEGVVGPTGDMEKP